MEKNNNIQNNNIIIEEKEEKEQNDNSKKEIDINIINPEINEENEKGNEIIEINKNDIELDKENKKYKIKFSVLIENLRQNSDKAEKININEFTTNLLLMSSQINQTNKISCLTLLSYIYYKRQNALSTYYINKKIFKYLKIQKSIEPFTYIRTLYRAAFFLEEEKNYFYAKKYVDEAESLGKNSKMDVVSYKMLKDIKESIEKKIGINTEFFLEKFRDIENIENLDEEKYKKMKKLFKDLNDNNYNNSYLVNNFEIKGYILDEDTIKRKINGEYIQLPESINGNYSNIFKIGLLEVNQNKVYDNDNYLLIAIINSELNDINSYLLAELVTKEYNDKVYFMINFDLNGTQDLIKVGQIFMHKYKMVFDYDNEEIGIYISHKINKSNKGNKEIINRYINLISFINITCSKISLSFTNILIS